MSCLTPRALSSPPKLPSSSKDYSVLVNFCSLWHLYGGEFGISVLILVQTTYPLSSFRYLSFCVTSELERLVLFWDEAYTFFFGINKIKMGNSKLALNWVPILVLVLMVVSISFVESSRKCLQATTSTISENRDTQGIEIKEADKAFGNGAKVLSTVDNSDRLVPSGPNPLHHNNNPIKP